uniref:Glutamyl-tRNA(Gln) amidotransferase subunit B, chloroplastic/mitochondrial n=1 Tax=Timema monikensis TaxID=170555 RepID=A0A7R9E370_9NEOP|nr:unnamed protein product [Timema monikensis]
MSNLLKVLDKLIETHECTGPSSGVRVLEVDADLIHDLGPSTREVVFHNVAHTHRELYFDEVRGMDHSINNGVADHRAVLFVDTERKRLTRFGFFVCPISNWESVVGLEIHAQISSVSKLFSGAGTQFGSPVNESVSFFDAAIPGTLPVLNRRCVEAGIVTALALSCKINSVSMFDRKHYFYADLPVSAYQFIILFLKIISTIHELYLDFSTLIDLNRAGIPLMEIVFEPDLQDGEEAAALVRELSMILERLGTCSCRMDEGALRVDANISVHKKGSPLGIRTEVKNIGSVRAVAHAIQFEIDRQVGVLESGGSIVNETRLWDAQCRQTLPMRDKEEKQDYRFMPEPNLPPLRVVNDGETSTDLSLVNVNELKTRLPELPAETRQKLAEQFCLPAESVIILVITEMNGWAQITNPLEIKKICEDVIIMNPDLVAKYLQGKTKIFKALIGEVAKITNQRANMALVTKELEIQLKKQQ